jgi:hypothetical protein
MPYISIKKKEKFFKLKTLDEDLLQYICFL